MARDLNKLIDLYQYTRDEKYRDAMFRIRKDLDEPTILSTPTIISNARVFEQLNDLIQPVKINGNFDDILENDLSNFCLEDERFQQYENCRLGFDLFQKWRNVLAQNGLITRQIASLLLNVPLSDLTKVKPFGRKLASLTLNISTHWIVENKDNRMNGTIWPEIAFIIRNGISQTRLDRFGL